MRAIKFRVWTGIKMEYNVMAGFLGAFYVQGIDPKDTACMSPFNTIYSEQVPVMQLTGLLDKNGKEIYEGDILKCERSYWVASRNLIVEWFGERYGLRNPNDYVDSEVMDKTSSFDVPERDREVIGNIYQNPELIK